MQVRKAYKKSALQLHPDKALKECRFTVRLGNQGLELSSRSEVGITSFHCANVYKAYLNQKFYIRLPND